MSRRLFHGIQQMRQYHGLPEVCHQRNSIPGDFLEPIIDIELFISHRL
jgi:hypothetical protein